MEFLDVGVNCMRTDVQPGGSLFLAQALHQQFHDSVLRGRQ
jgi:hypothetical protein